MQTNPAVEQSKIIRWSESPWNESCRKGKGLWRKGFAEEPSLESVSKYSVEQSNEKSAVVNPPLVFNWVQAAPGQKRETPLSALLV